MTEESREVCKEIRQAVRLREEWIGELNNRFYPTRPLDDPDSLVVNKKLREIITFLQNLRWRKMKLGESLFILSNGTGKKELFMHGRERKTTRLKTFLV